MEDDDLRHLDPDTYYAFDSEVLAELNEREMRQIDVTLCINLYEARDGVEYFHAIRTLVNYPPDFRGSELQKSEEVQKTLTMRDSLRAHALDRGIDLRKPMNVDDMMRVRVISWASDLQCEGAIDNVMPENLSEIDAQRWAVMALLREFENATAELNYVDPEGSGLEIVIDPEQEDDEPVNLHREVGRAFRRKYRYIVMSSDRLGWLETLEIRLSHLTRRARRLRPGA